jgi:hypothetical protein
MNGDANCVQRFHVRKFCGFTNKQANANGIDGVFPSIMVLY